MNWQRRQSLVAQQLAPEVASFVLEALHRLEQENVFDAPGVIGGVLGSMRIAESDLVRNSVQRAEHLLKSAFTNGVLQSVGA